tara:strand:+ start:353 stop:664 length:312 start_codon:yes stop_codon:yes gene_type:complete
MENNTLILEFMGNPTIFNPIHDATLYQVKEQGNMVYHLDELQYHNSWDWLMPVVDKIKSISGKLPTHIGNIPNDEDWESNNFLATNIEETYRAVVEFIKDQNK